MSLEQTATMGFAEAMSLCSGPAKQYLAALQSTTPEALFGTAAEPAACIQFRDTLGRMHNLRFGMRRDKWYQFDITTCPGRQQVTSTMQRMALHMQMTVGYLIAHGIQGTLAHPELFAHNARLALSPISTMFLANDMHARRLHDDFDERIVFEWAPDSEVPNAATAAQVAAAEERKSAPVSAESVAEEIQSAIDDLDNTDDEDEIDHRRTSIPIDELNLSDSEESSDDSGDKK